MNNDMDFEFFDGKTLKDVCKEIVDNSQTKRNQLDIVISDLRTKISNINDAVALAPIIKGFLDTSVKNDEILVKLASIAQKLISTKTVCNSGENLSGITEEEKKSLLSSLGRLKSESMEPVNVSIMEDDD